MRLTETKATMLRSFLSALCGLFLATVVSAQDAVVIAVEDADWTPYYMWEDGVLDGACAEIAVGAFNTMGVEVEFQRVPWTRVLKSVQNKTVDGGLCATKSAERESYTIYPDEHLLNYDSTLFVRVDSEIEVFDAATLVGRSFATVKGYAFGGADQALIDYGMVRREANNRDSLLKILMAGRVDMVLDSTLPLQVDAERLALNDQIRALKPSVSLAPGYIMFSKKDGHDALVAEFTKALVAFKATDEYRDIAARYNIEY